MNDNPFQPIDLDTATMFLVDEYATMGKEQTRELIYAILKVIPEHVINDFEAITHFEEMMQWEKGDLTNEIWYHVSEAKLTNLQGKPYTFLDVCYFVSVRFLNRTRSYNTVKAWALTARRFPQEVRERYKHEEIPFAHFTYAGKRKFDNVGVDGKRIWQNILETSFEQRTNQGYDTSVAFLEEKFEGKVRVVPGYEVGTEDREIENMPQVTLESTSLEVEFAAALYALTTLADRLSGNPKVLELIKQGLTLLRVALEQLSKEEKL